MQVLSKGDYKLFTSICSLNQKGLKKTLASYLNKHYKTVHSTKDYIFAEGDIPIALVAHMDTVWKTPPKDIFYDREKNVIWSPEGGCGDDRAGVFAILKILQSGLRPSVIFTTDEESGAIGATQLVKEIPKCPIDLRYIIQLDRRGTNDCVFYSCDNPVFTEYVEKFGFLENWGSFSDISVICPEWGIAGVNLSVGYENEHSVSEIVRVSALLDTIRKVQVMLKETDIPSFEYIEEVYFGRKWMSAYGYPTDEYDYDFDMYYIKCSHCRKTYSEYEMFPVKGLDGKTKFVCPDCIAKREKIHWCKTCGEAYEVEEGDTQSFLCKDCQKGGNVTND